MKDEAEFGDDVAVARRVFAVCVDGPEDGDGGAIGGEGIEWDFAFAARAGDGGGGGGAAGGGV